MAALLSVPVRADQGQPTALALIDSPATEQAAAESGALASLQPVAARPAPAPGELPAVAPAHSQPAVDLAQYRPVAAPIALAPGETKCALAIQLQPAPKLVGEQPFLIRATALQQGKWLVKSETTVLVEVRAK